MNSTTIPLSQSEIRTLRQLFKISGIRGIYLAEKDIDTLLPNQDKIKKCTEGYINLDLREVLIQHHTKDKSITTIQLNDHHPMDGTPDNYEDYVDGHYTTQISLLQRLLGLETLLDCLTYAMYRKYEGISEGQAKAVTLKYISSFREDPSVMSLIIRTQLYRLRQKLEKYKKVVDAFYPLLMMENISFDEIAEKLTPLQK